MTDGAAILVKLKDGASGSLFKRQTSHVTFHPARSLTIVADGIAESGTFMVLQCEGGDDALVHYFLRVAETLPLDDAPESLEQAVAQLFELFRNLTSNGSNTVQGTWAECLVVAYATDPVFMVSAWHSEATDTHDFVGDGHDVEVKSSIRGLREHEFSLEQLELRKAETTVISILLAEHEAGATVFDLLKTIKERVPAGSAKRAELLVSKSLGSAWRDAESIRFNVREALFSLVNYEAESIPRPLGPLPAAVSNVHFRADLTALPPAKPNAATIIAALPRPRSSGLLEGNNAPF